MQFGELQSVSESTSQYPAQEAITEVLEDWNREPGLSVACDLVSASFTAGLTHDASGAVDYILSHPSAPKAAKNIASRFAAASFDSPNVRFCEQHAETQVAQLGRAIRDTRIRLQRYPINPVLWTNLSLFYTTLGMEGKATRAMLVARDLASENRFVTRSACRLFVHLDDIEQAHGVVLGAPGLRSDPWILSAEIALAAIQQRSSRFIRTARRMIDSKNHSSFHLSELTSALATVEAQSGGLKKARSLCEKSLIEPAENSVAQAAWLSRNAGLRLPVVMQKNVRSSEADAWGALEANDWQRALVEAKNWQSQQPFSSRPAILAGNIASTILEDFSEAVAILRQAAASNRGDVTVANNLAFSLARQGNEEQAGKVLGRIDPVSCTERQRVCVMATAGLICFRGGDPDQGRRLYKHAVESADRLGIHDLSSIAKVYLAVEESTIGSSEAESARRKALAALKSMDEPIAAVYRSKVQEAHRNSGCVLATERD